MIAIAIHMTIRYSVKCINTLEQRIVKYVPIMQDVCFSSIKSVALRFYLSLLSLFETVCVCEWSIL